MAPEQVEHPQTVDHRADIYSLGVVFYEMLTGELPLGKFAPPSKKVQVDVRLDEVVLHALEKEPELRYQQASQVKTAVEAIATSPELSGTRCEEAQTEGLRPEAAKGSERLASSTAKLSGRAMAWVALCVLSLGGVWGIAAFRSHSWPFKPTLKVLAPDKGTLSAGLPASGQQMVGGIFIDDVAVINNSKPVMSDDFNSGRLTGWTAPQPRVVVTPVARNSTNYCLYMNRENNVKTYARHSVQCNDVGALELQAKVFLPQPAEQWGYNHGKQERTAIGLTTGRDEHRFSVQIVISPGELAYHVELVHLKMEIKEPDGRSETYSSRERVIAPCKWALVSFQLDPTAGTATVYVDGQPHVSCPYDPGKITRLNELFLTTFMGNLEPAVNPKARGLPKKSPSRMGNPEPTVNAAGEATAQAGSAAGPEELHFKKLLSRLSAAPLVVVASIVGAGVGTLISRGVMRRQKSLGQRIIPAALSLPLAIIAAFVVGLLVVMVEETVAPPAEPSDVGGSRALGIAVCVGGPTGLVFGFTGRALNRQIAAKSASRPSTA